MSKFKFTMAIAILAVSAPAIVFASEPDNDPYLQPTYGYETYQECNGSGSSAARGSIYDMAGPTSCTEKTMRVVTGDECVWWWGGGEYIVAGSQSSGSQADKFQRICRKIVAKQDDDDDDDDDDHKT